MENNDITIIMFLQKTGRLLYKKKAVLSVFLVLGIFSAGALLFIYKPYYTARLVGSSDIDSRIIVTLVERLDRQLEEGNIGILAEQLGVDDKLITTIKDIKARQDLAVDPLNKLASESNVNYFEIKVEIYDNSDLDTLQPAIIYYIENNAFVRESRSRKKENLVKLNERVSTEVNALDTLKHKLGANINRVTTGGPGMLMFSSDAYKNTVDLYEKQLKLESELEALKNIRIIMPFQKAEKPSSVSKAAIVMLSVILFLAIGIIYVIAIELNRHST